MKRLLPFILLLTTLFIFTSCKKNKLYNEFKVEIKDQQYKTITEKEELDLANFIFTYYNEKGKKETITNYNLLTHNYNSNIMFNHFDDTNKITQEVTFNYGNYSSNTIEITTIRKEVKTVVVTNFGNLAYTYGDLFDVDNYKLNVTYADNTTETINLELNMLDLDEGLILPNKDEFDSFKINVWYNGIKTNNPIVLNNISKKPQHLTQQLIVEDFDDYSITVNKIENAEYAFIKEGNQLTDLDFIYSNVYISNEPITENYTIYVRLKETFFDKPSNAISTTFIYSKPVALFNYTYSDTNITVKVVDGYNLYLIDGSNNIIEKLTPINNNYFIPTSPNKTYKLGFKEDNSDTFNEQNIKEITTKQANIDFLTITDQTYTYGDNIEVIYTIKEHYNNDDLLLDVKYFKDNTLVSDIVDAGIYQIIITNNFNDITYEVFITIKKYEVTVTTNDLKYNGEFQDVILDYELVNNDQIILTTQSIKDAGTYHLTILVNDLSNSLNNYIFPETITVVIKQSLNLIKGNSELINNMEVIEIEYTNNFLINDKIIDLFELDEKDDYSFIFKTNNKIVTHFDLSNGATTFILNIDADSISGNNEGFYQDIIVKYKSVLLNKQYYTIEDAIYKASSKDLLVIAYNTSFSSSEVRNTIYNNSNHYNLVNNTLLVPYDSSFKTNLTNTTKTPTTTDRNNSYSKLYITEGVELIFDYDSKMIVNGLRGSAHTKFQGFVSGSNYGQVILEENSKVIINGELDVLGFITGKGVIEVSTTNLNKSAKVKESMFIKDFRGGTVTRKIYKETFPFNQFTLMNIQVELILNKNTELIALATAQMSGIYFNNEVTIISHKSSKELIHTKDATITKKYNGGKITIDVDGNIEINVVSVSIILGVSVSNNGLEIAFDGSWEINIKSGSTLEINSWIMLLPGATLNVEQGATIYLNEANNKYKNGSRVVVYNPYEYRDMWTEYSSSNGSEYYLEDPTINYNEHSLANFNINGTVIVKGDIAGKVNVSNTGTLDVANARNTSFNTKYVWGEGSNAYSEVRTVELFVNQL